MEFISEIAHQYCLKHSSKETELLQEIHEYTIQHRAEHHMISGPIQGKFLSMISQMIQPKRILEIGTFTGYSALCLAEGLPEDGVLHTIEHRAEDAQVAQTFFDRSPYNKKIVLHNGDAHQIIQTLKENWDLVFVDADKTGYIEYYNILMDQVQTGTFLIFDNVLFHGEVLEDPLKGKNAKAISVFNEYITADKRIEHVMLTVRDGLTVIRKK